MMLTSRPGRSSNGCPKRRHGQAWREAEEEMEETKPGSSSSSNGKPALLLPTTTTKTTTVEGADITDPKIMPFLRAFFADAPIDDQTVDSFVECHQACGSQLDSLVFGSPARHAFPAKRRSHRELCKRLISKFEQLGLEPSDILYEHLCRTLAEESEQSHFYRIFPLVDFHRQLHCSDYVVCQEAVHQISQGTTGLSCWQASFVLADFLLLLLLRANSHFSPAAAANCCILELGAGCGLAGIALAKQLAKNAAAANDGQNAAANDEPKLRVVLTDLCHPVLDQLHANVRLNFGTFVGGGGTGTRVDTGTHVEVQRLDWTDYEADQLPAADLIIAADIVYDPALFPALVGLLRKLLSAAGAAAVSSPSSSMQMQQPILCLLACTVRDPATVEAFLRCAAQHGIKASAHWEHRFFGGSSTAESKKSQKHSFVRLDVHDDDDDENGRKLKMGTMIEFEPVFSHALPVSQPIAHFPTQIFEFSMKAHC